MSALPGSKRQILALGGGGFTMEPESPLLDDFALACARGRRVCFVPTASGDSPEYIEHFYDTLGARCQPSHLSLFARDGRDLREHVLSQDAIYVGGGNPANLLAVWRVHGLDAILREAYDSGVLLCGVSAGAVCWFEGGVTDSFGPLAPLTSGLGLARGTVCCHYDTDPARPAVYQHQIGRGLPAGFGIEEGAALHLVDGALVEVVASRPAARAYRVELEAGEVRQRELPARYLGA